MENTENTIVNDTQTETQSEEVKTYTQEEVLALLQSETDKRVSQALKTQQKKYEKQLSLSKLDGDERAKAEKDNRIAELEEHLPHLSIISVTGRPSQSPTNISRRLISVIISNPRISALKSAVL